MVFLGSQTEVLGKKQHACKLQKGKLDSLMACIYIVIHSEN